MTVHDLKVWPEYFEGLVSGRKTFEVRRDDRGFVEGDLLRLREWVPSTATFTGSQRMAVVTYLLRGPMFGIEAGFVVMGLGRPSPDECAAVTGCLLENEFRTCAEPDGRTESEA